MKTPCKLSAYVPKPPSMHCQVKIAGKNIYHHRLAYCEAHGLDLSAIKGKLVMHTCDVPNCINPDHLVLGTDADNMADRDAKGRQAKGTANGKSKLTAEAAAEIRTLSATGKFYIRELSVRFGVKNSTISAVISGRTWK